MGHDRGVQDAHVGDRARLGEAGLLVALLQRGVHVLSELDAAPQARLLQGPRRHPAQVARARLDPPVELRLSCREPGQERLGERRDGLPLQARDLLRQPLHRRVRVGVAVPEGTELRLLGDQLVQGLGKVGALLHGLDRLERRGRQARVAPLRNHLR